MAAYLKFDGVDVKAAVQSGVNAAMADGSVRFADDGAPAADSFDFTAGAPQASIIGVLIGLLLPAVQKAQGDDAEFEPMLFATPDERGADVVARHADISRDDVAIDGRIVAAEDWA